MSLDSTAPHSGLREEPGVHHALHDPGDYSARATVGEKLFLWIGWAIVAGIVAVTLVMYLPAFLATSPDTDPMAPAPAAVSTPAAPPAAATPTAPAAAPAP